MATYRILHRNGIFKGHPGSIVIAEPGPLMTAAVRSGILTRTDIALDIQPVPPVEAPVDVPDEDQEPKPRKRRKATDE